MDAGLDEIVAQTLQNTGLYLARSIDRRDEVWEDALKLRIVHPGLPASESNPG
jgi:hypothetical protein